MKMKTPSVGCRVSSPVTRFFKRAPLTPPSPPRISFDHAIPGEADLFVVEGAGLQLNARPQLVAAVNDVDAIGEARQKDAFFQRRIAAADHDDVLAAEEEAIASAAIADASADILFFARHAQLARVGADGDDDGVGQVVVTQGLDVEGRAIAEVDALDQVEFDFRAKVLGMFFHALDQFGSAQAIGEAGVIFNLMRDGDPARQAARRR